MHEIVCMQQDKEISALFSLIDDPDEEVYGAVSNRIADFGRSLIPNLEHLWETTPNEQVQQRIESLIHRLQLQDLQNDLLAWKTSAHPDLLAGALLCTRFQYPDLTIAPVLSELEKLRRNVWLELNNYLTPLEQINVLTSILFNYYGLKGKSKDYSRPEEFLLQTVLSSKKGNAFGNGLIYLLLCEGLDIPIRAIRIPGQFVLAYFKPVVQPEGQRMKAVEKIEYFIEPASGQVFTRKEVDGYFKKMDIEPTPAYFSPLNNIDTIALLLTELANCFDNEAERHKKDELLALAKLLEN
jgi:regulator of sirC expression with transglutaminase-like and TPR domain